MAGVKLKERLLGNNKPKNGRSRVNPNNGDP
jgi:hypothetical protein